MPPRTDASAGALLALGARPGCGEFGVHGARTSAVANFGACAGESQPGVAAAADGSTGPYEAAGGVADAGAGGPDDARPVEPQLAANRTVPVAANAMLAAGIEALIQAVDGQVHSVAVERLVLVANVGGRLRSWKASWYGRSHGLRIVSCAVVTRLPVACGNIERMAGTPCPVPG
jgi:hypothetical protein